MTAVFLFFHVVRIMASTMLSFDPESELAVVIPPSLLSYAPPRRPTDDLSDGPAASSSSGISRSHLLAPPLSTNGARSMRCATRVDDSLNRNNATRSATMHNMSSIPIGTFMYPSQTHSPTHCCTQSSAFAHTCSALAATHAALRFCVFHAHSTPDLSIEP